MKQGSRWIMLYICVCYSLALQWNQRHVCCPLGFQPYGFWKEESSCRQTSRWGISLSDCGPCHFFFVFASQSPWSEQLTFLCNSTTMFCLTSGAKQTGLSDCQLKSLKLWFKINLLLSELSQKCCYSLVRLTQYSISSTIWLKCIFLSKLPFHPYLKSIDHKWNDILLFH